MFDEISNTLIDSLFRVSGRQLGGLQYWPSFSPHLKYFVVFFQIQGSSLEYIDLSSNEIGDGAIAALEQCLQSSKVRMHPHTYHYPM